MTYQLPKEAYCKFWDFYTTEQFEGCPIVSFEKYKLDHKARIGSFYNGMEEDFTREIINSLNRFSHEINAIEIWREHIFPKYSKDDQFELSYYFLELSLDYCLNQPQAIRDRIIYAATHLCHQANIYRKIKGYKDDLVDNYKINIDQLIKRAKPWASKIKLETSLKNIAAEEYIKATFNYRNLSHHRVPPGLEYGTTNLIKRIGYQEKAFKYTTFENGVEVTKEKTTKGVAYGFGGTPPLTSKELIPLFKSQFNLLTIALKSYWNLVMEHQEYAKKGQK
jgi:hypothetical protein